MKQCFLLFNVVLVLLLCSCRQQQNHMITYPFQEDRALAGVRNAEGKMAYFIVNTQQEVVSYIHLTDIQLDTIYREGRLSFRHIPSGREGFFDLQGQEVWLDDNSSEKEQQSSEQLS